MADADPSPNAPQHRLPATQEMLDAAVQFESKIRTRDALLAGSLLAFRGEQSDSVRANQAEFQHQVAYAVESAEKVLGHQLPLSPESRSDLRRLAGSAPGLDNDRMIALLQSTPDINNRDLVGQIRIQAFEIGRQSNQNTDQIRDRLDHLEHAVSQADRAPSLAPPPVAPKADATATATATPTSTRIEQPDRPQATAESRAGAKRELPPETSREEAARIQEAQRQAAGRQQQAHAQSFPSKLVDSLNGVVRNAAGGGTSAPWDTTPQPFADRLAAFETSVRESRDDAGLRKAERAGRAALDAMEGFRTGDGATIMNRIASAARSDPEGMYGVLAGMREGGRYQDLRQQFNSALVEEKGFAQAYDKAAEALARYGEARTGVEQIIARRPDAANLTAKLQQMDAEIGEKAESTPSRREGKTSLEDIAKQAAEIIQKAVESVKSVFTPKGPEHTSRPGPSPS